LAKACIITAIEAGGRTGQKAGGLRKEQAKNQIILRELEIELGEVDFEEEAEALRTLEEKRLKSNKRAIRKRVEAVIIHHEMP